MLLMQPGNKWPGLWIGIAIVFTTSVSAQIVDESPATSPDAVVHIRVHTDRPAAATLPKTIFGSFLEPIGHSIYGGLWAELLENGSLEENLWSAGVVARMVHERPELERASDLGLPLPWEPIDSHQGNRYEPRWGDAANSARSLEVMALPAGETGIRQRIYLPVQRELAYDGSLWIKHLSGPAPISVSLRKRDDATRILAEARFDAGGADWSRYKFHLDLKLGQVEPLEPVDFVISLGNDERALLDEISLMPSDNVEGMDPDVLKMARDLKPPVVRFGGNFTSAYHWRDGIGPREKRVSELNLAWSMPEYNSFGTDEFLRFCELVNAEPQIALNLGTGTPEEAADWVKYVNEHWGNKRGGLLWEMGNELWGNWNAGYPAREQIGARTKEFEEAIRRVDPNSRLIGTGQDPDNYKDWNAVQLSTPKGSFNFLSTHFVVTTDNVQLGSPSNDFIALSTFALPTGLGRQLEQMTEQIQHSEHKDAKIAFTEWLFVSNRQTRGRATPDFNNMGGAIGTGGFLNMLLSHADIVPISDMTGIVEFAGIWKKREQVYGAPGYWVLRSYAEASPTHLMPTESDAPTYTVDHGVTRLPHIEHVPWLDVVAAQGANEDVVVLFCVNRSLSRDYRATITLDGFRPAAVATAKTITAPSIYTQNSETDPDAVGVILSQPPTSSPTRYVFPHASLVVLEFHRVPKR
jgi:alpha-L-arabinofuranosidase